MESFLLLISGCPVALFIGVIQYFPRRYPVIINILSTILESYACIIDHSFPLEVDSMCTVKTENANTKHILF